MPEVNNIKVMNKPMPTARVRITEWCGKKVITKPFRKKAVRHKLALIEDIEDKYGIDIIEFFNEYEKKGYFTWSKR